jgi:hypothetical protein
MISVRALTSFTNGTGVLLTLPLALTATNSICVQNATLHTNNSALLSPTRYKY